MNRDPRCIIMAAGDFVPVEIPHGDDDLIIACDAGFRHLELMGILPDLILGDFDSAAADPAMLEQILEIERLDPGRVLRLPVEKDDTDTMRAAREGLARGYRRFFLYGAFGGSRFDHTLANLQTVLFLKRNGARAYMMAHDQMVLAAENERIDFSPGLTGGLSVFSAGERAEGVTICGTQYEMKGGTITNDFPIGVSNELLSNRQATVEVKNGALFIVVRFADGTDH